jgi:chemotaxis protein histidine kinase CheA
LKGLKAAEQNESAEMKEAIKASFSEAAKKLKGSPSEQKQALKTLQNLKTEAERLIKTTSDGDDNLSEKIEELVNDNKKGFKLWSKIGDKLDEGGEAALKNIKSSLAESFGEVGVLTQNLGKAAFSLGKKAFGKGDDEEPAKVQRVAKEPEPAANDPAPVATPKSDSTPEGKPQAQIIDITPFLQPMREDMAAIKQSADKQTDVVSKLATRMDDNSLNENLSAIKLSTDKQTDAVLSLVTRLSTQTPATEPIAAPSPPPMAQKITKEAVKPTRQEKKNFKKDQLAQHALASRTGAPQPSEFAEAAKNLDLLDPIHDKLSIIADATQEQLKLTQSSSLMNNSNELQAAKPGGAGGGGDIPVPASAEKKAKGLSSDGIGSLLGGIIGSIGKGGILGTLSTVFTAVTGFVGKFMKPLLGLGKTLLSSGKMIPIIGQVVGIVMALFDFMDGWNNAASILGKDGKLLTVWDKFSAAIGSVIGGLVSLVDDVLGLFGIQTSFGDTVKKAVATFIDELPGKVMAFFDDTMKDVNAVMASFGTSFLEGITNLGKLALKTFLTTIPGGSALAKMAGLDLSIKGGAESKPSGGDSKPAGGLSPVTKPTASFAPKAEANSQTIKESERAAATPVAPVVASTNNNQQVVNNNTYSSSPLSTRGGDEDSHRYGLV